MNDQANDTGIENGAENDASAPPAFVPIEIDFDDLIVDFDDDDDDIDFRSCA